MRGLRPYDPTNNESHTSADGERLLHLGAVWHYYVDSFGLPYNCFDYRKTASRVIVS